MNAFEGSPAPARPRVLAWMVGGKMPPVAPGEPSLFVRRRHRGQR